MVLINKKYAVSVSLTKVYEDCIKNIDMRDNITHKNNIMMIYMWLPNISTIDVSTDETIVRFKDEKDEINLGFTGYEWIFDEYVDRFYTKE